MLVNFEIISSIFSNHDAWLESGIGEKTIKKKKKHGG